MKLTHEKVSAVQCLHENGFSLRQIARLIGISHSTVSNLVRANFNHEAYTKNNRINLNKRFIGMTFTRINGKEKIAYR